MEIRERIDNSNIRLEAESKNVPLIELLMEKVRELSERENTNHTLFAICPNSENVLGASLRAAKKANALGVFSCNV